MAGSEENATYEYTYVAADAMNSAVDMVKALNDLGTEGWQLVTLEAADTMLAVVRRPIESLPPPDELAEGWYDDPSGRFDMRLWNGRAWTFSVARKADESVHRDPPTMRTPTPGLKQ
jgi:hypothetical protein